MSLINYVLNSTNRCPKKCKSTNSLNSEPAVVPRAYAKDLAPENLADRLTRRISLSDLFSENQSGKEASRGTEPAWVKRLNNKFEKVSKSASIFRIGNVDDFHALMQHANGVETNKLPTNVFPYMHGLNSLKQRVFYSNKHVSDIDSLSLGKYELEEYTRPIELPYSEYFNLMVVNTSMTSDSILKNSVKMDELLTPKSSHEKTPTPVLQFARLNEINDIQYNFHEEIDNRNFKHQIKLTAPLSHFIVYNPENNYANNLNSATLISRLSSNKNIYIIDFDLASVDEEYLDHEDHEMFPISEVDDRSFECKLLKWEQNMIWKHSSMKSLCKNCYLGNIVDFNYLIGEESSKTFRLFIKCQEGSTFPSLDSLHDIYRDLRNNSLNNTYYLEFPASGSVDPSSINNEELLSMLNTLKLIFHLIHVQNEQVFIFSFDGFTGLSLLSIAISELLYRTTIEKCLLQLLGNSDGDNTSLSELKLYFFKSDLLFLKSLEHFTMNMSNKLCSGDCTPIKLMDLKTFNIEFEDRLSFRSLGTEYDWFDLNKDNNFPCKIFDGFYLGSLNHASSLTILDALNITKVISIGEKPWWFNILRVSFDFEKNPKYEVINPIFTFNGGESKIYEVELTDDRVSKKYPKIQSIIYIYNLHDDGKDSILPLLTQCPEHIQSKFLINPDANNMNTLLHCRIGVSRSASLAIASLMKHRKMSLIHAYMYVRVRRFNIIIQPNLRIFYELYLYEEHLNLKRSYSWWYMCNEIHKLNKHYIDNV